MCSTYSFLLLVQVFKMSFQVVFTLLFLFYNTELFLLNCSLPINLIDSVCSTVFSTSVVEPEPVEPKLFWGIRAGTGAIVNYFGSGSTAQEPKLSF